MSTTKIARTIQAPAEAVFAAVAHVEEFSAIVPEIVKVELLSETRRGVGTRFRETRLMGKREASTELEITEYVPDERVRFVSDAGGTIWDTVFTIAPAGDGRVELALVMEARAYKLLAKLLNPLIMGMVRKAIAKDLDAVKAHCEG